MTTAAPAFADRLTATLRTRLAPPPKMTVSQWADRHRILSREASAEPGLWRTDRAPYARDIMDAFSDPRVERVVVMSASQISKSEIILNVLGYYIDQDPAPILLMQPTIHDAEQFSKLRVATMLRDTPRLRAKVKDPRSRDSGNTLLTKEFPGGWLGLAGANAPSAIAGRPIRIVLRDERDRFPASAGTEGDPGALSDKRTSTFWNRKLGDFSSPLLKGYSPIESLFLAGDQRRYYVPCTECRATQILKWERLRWEDGDPATAVYRCESCDAAIREQQKQKILRNGAWKAHAPFDKTASFHINALYSPWARWSDLVAEFLTAQKEIGRLQVFVNTVLGESWEDRGGGLDPDSLFANRREAYDTVPAAVGVLTAGVDVQHDRIEVIVRGWAAGEESYLIERKVLFGDPTSDKIWSDLDAYRATAFPHESGSALRIYTTCVDSGDHSDRVYRYCAPRFRQRVYAVKGSSNPAAPFMPKRPSRNNKWRCPLFVLGVNAAKAVIYGRLKIIGPSLLEACPYRYRFNESADRDYFDQLTAEKAERKYLARLWVTVYTCPAHKRNEALDCEVYALAALNLSNVPKARIGEQRYGEIARQDAPASVETQTAAETDGIQLPAAVPRRPPKRGFVTGWK